MCILERNVDLERLVSLFKIMRLNMEFRYKLSLLDFIVKVSKLWFLG